MPTNVGKLVVTIGGETYELDRAMGRSKKTINDFARTGIASVRKFAGVLGGLGVTIGGAAIFAGIVRSGARFEQTMTTAAAVMRATADEAKDLTAIARKMGETTEWTASQAGDALQFLGMAGFQAADAIDALPGVLDLATAGNLDLGRAADIASNALTAMNLPVEELSRVNDVFVGTITRANTNMEMMAESFKYSAPVAKAYGYNIEELSGLIGMLGNAGIQGSMAGTQLAMAFQKSNELAAKFGLESSDLIDVLEDLSAQGYENTQIMDMFGLRAGRAVGVLLDLIPETKEFQETLGDVGGEAETLADKMRSTVGGAFKELQSVVESTGQDIYDLFRDDLKNAITTFTSTIRDNKTEIIGFFEELHTVVTDILWVLEKIGQVGGAISGFVGSIDDLMGVMFPGVPKREDIKASMEESLRLEEQQKKEQENIERQLIGYRREAQEDLATALGLIPEAVPVRTKKKVTPGIGDAEDLANVKREAEALANTMENLADQEQKAWESLVKARVSGYEDLLSQESLTYEQLENYSEQYMRAVEDLSLVEEERLKNLGMDSEEASAIVQKSVDDAQRKVDALWATMTGPPAHMERKDVKETVDNMVLLAEDAARAMMRTFDDLFFDTMKGEWKSLKDYIQSITDDILRSLSRRMATEVGAWFLDVALSSLGKKGGGGGGGGGGGSGGGGGVGGFHPIELQHGGIVREPTLAVIGEVPEAVVPLSKLSNSSWMNSIQSPGGASIHVEQNITTPDIASFNQNRQQMVTDLAFAVEQARRNM